MNLTSSRKILSQKDVLPGFRIYDLNIYLGRKTCGFEIFKKEFEIVLYVNDEHLIVKGFEE